MKNLFNKLTQGEKQRILEMHSEKKTNLTEDLKDYSAEQFWDDLNSMSKPSPMFDYEHETIVTPKKFNDAIDNIMGKTFASFGDLGKYVELIKDKSASHEENKILEKLPVIDVFSSYEEFKDSPYYEMTQNFFKSNSFHNENEKRKSFEHFIDSFGDLIIKKGDVFGKNMKKYKDKSKNLSPQEKQKQFTIGVNKVHQDYDDDGNIIDKKNKRLN